MDGSDSKRDDLIKMRVSGDFPIKSEQLELYSPVLQIRRLSTIGKRNIVVTSIVFYYQIVCKGEIVFDMFHYILIIAGIVEGTMLEGKSSTAKMPDSEIINLGYTCEHPITYVKNKNPNILEYKVKKTIEKIESNFDEDFDYNGYVKRNNIFPEENEKKVFSELKTYDNSSEKQGNSLHSSLDNSFTDDIIFNNKDAHPGKTVKRNSKKQIIFYPCF
ncbi:hypothetical protein CWI38_0044p0080 [Hamiltosporidium tvaerminnensis]|uniref:Uncharacterized protein n=1 Tax=Hamiltosporidium tvaerminnensis TaxID=1176355 RepID=A0A4Q9M1M5_9MICR|nr:hypothetical protein CWI38_0044p0080 [Hamiltosporidium tvaerminnensis]